MPLGKFITENKKSITIVAVVLVGFLGYKYVAKKIKDKKAQQDSVNADINALNNQPAITQPQSSNSLLSFITLGLYK